MSARLPKTIKATQTLPEGLVPLLTIHQAALFLNKSVSTVERMVATNDIPFYRIGSCKRKSINFDIAELVEWKRKQAVPVRKTSRFAQQREAQL